MAWMSTRGCLRCRILGAAGSFCGMVPDRQQHCILRKAQAKVKDLGTVVNEFNGKRLLCTWLDLLSSAACTRCTHNNSAIHAIAKVSWSIIWRTMAKRVTNKHTQQLRHNKLDNNRYLEKKKRRKKKKRCRTRWDIFCSSSCKANPIPTFQVCPNSDLLLKNACIFKCWIKEKKRGIHRQRKRACLHGSKDIREERKRVMPWISTCVWCCVYMPLCVYINVCVLAYVKMCVRSFLYRRKKRRFADNCFYAS